MNNVLDVANFTSFDTLNFAFFCEHCSQFCNFCCIIYLIRYCAEIILKLQNKYSVHSSNYGTIVILLFKKRAEWNSVRLRFACKIHLIGTNSTEKGHSESSLERLSISAKIGCRASIAQTPIQRTPINSRAFSPSHANAKGIHGNLFSRLTSASSA